jgi:hypothetical protein
MTAAVLFHRPSRRPHRSLTETLANVRTLVADSVRLANALEAAPTPESRRKLTERFVEVHRAA